MLGTDDREYRKANDYDEHYSDTVSYRYRYRDAQTAGEEDTRASITWSPVRPLHAGVRRQGLEHDFGPRRQGENLTAKLPVKFFNEEDRYAGPPAVVWRGRLD